MYRSSIGWADFDRDGDQDILLCGETNKHEIITRIYNNNGWGFFNSYDPGIIGVRDGAIDIGDYNKDGWNDIVICGENNGVLYSKIYKGFKNSFSEINANIIPLSGGSAEWGDYDNDGDLDILLSGESSGGGAFTKVYNNSGNNSFIDIGLNCIGIKNGTALWADFDGDNDLDIFICGESNNNYLLSRFYRNDGGNKFTELKPSIKGARDGNVEATDYDCDGDIDILVSGETVNNPSVLIYRNEGDFKFVEVESELPGVYLGGAYWGDYDKDCDNDIFIIGLDDCYNFIAKLYRNDMEVEIPVAEVKITNSLWIQSDILIKDRPNYYYFVWSSCYCNPEGEKDKDYHMYVSNIHFVKKPYVIQKRFNNIIVTSIPDWGEINGGHRVSIGYKTKAEAEAARRQVIRDYDREKFSINYVNW
jgi:hypothetical protein